MSHTQPRLNFMDQLPALTEKLMAFSLAVSDSHHIRPALAVLVDLRASQLNGCTFCIDMHVKQARLRGERELRLHHLAGWRESQLFSAQERAALAWTEALTCLAPEGVPDAVYHKVREQFAEQELAALTFHIMSINAWNRANVAFRTTPGALDALFGLEDIGLG